MATTLPPFTLVQCDKFRSAPLRPSSCKQSNAHGQNSITQHRQYCKAHSTIAYQTAATILAAFSYENHAQTTHCVMSNCNT